MIVFLDALEHSPLSEDERLELRESAETNGISEELWTRLNDRLIVAVVRSRERQSLWHSQIDDEIARYTASYEKEKTVIDRRMINALAAADSEAAKSELWAAYGQEIKILQGRLLDEVRNTSQTVLREAFQTTIGAN